VHLKSKLDLALSLVFCVFSASAAHADFVIAPGFSQTSTMPAEFQSSTGLSVTVDASGNLRASNALNLSTFSFDSPSSASIPFTFATPWVGAASIRYDPAGNLSLLTYNYNGAGAILRPDGAAGYTQLAEFASNQSFPRGFAYAPSGALLVAGGYGNIDQPQGWLRSYSAAGNLIGSFDAAISPVAVDYSPSGQAFIATFNGEIYTLSGEALVPFATLTAPWVGEGIGYVESLAIDHNNNVFVGVNVGQLFDTNSSAILRIGSDGVVRLLALGVGDIPMDMTFGPDNELLVASFVPNDGSQVYRFSGDFAGDFQSLSIPEPRFALLFITPLAVCLLRRPRTIS
jgi:hypothetical protein